MLSCTESKARIMTIYVPEGDWLQPGTPSFGIISPCLLLPALSPQSSSCLSIYLTECIASNRMVL